MAARGRGTLLLLLLLACGAYAHDNLVASLSAEEQPGVGVVITAGTEQAVGDTASNAVTSMSLDYEVLLPAAGPPAVTAMAQQSDATPVRTEKSVAMTRVQGVPGGCARCEHAHRHTARHASGVR
jgi:hypothetical protein